jgi:colanic acid biosynthesis glycosyl transferase WcaI
MRITILHMRYRPDLTGTGPLVAELASDLAARGEEVAVVTTFPHYGKRPVSPEYGRGIVSRRIENGVSIWRTLAFPYASGTVAGRALDYSLYMGLSVAAGVGGARPDVVLAVAPPMTVGFSGWWVSRLWQCPLVFNAQDIWPDGLISMGKLRNRTVIQAFRGLERFTYRAAQRITVLSDGMKENLLRKGIPASKVAVLPNWVDLEAVRPVEKENAFRRELGLEGRFVVLFAGNLGFAAGLEAVLRAADLLRKELDLVFLLVGEGSVKAKLVQSARALNLENVHFATTQPPERLSEVFGAADVSLVTLRSTMGAFSVPSKTMAILASGRPVLASVPADSEVRRVVEEAQCGLWVPPEDPDALAAKVKALRADRQRLEWFGRNGRRYAMDHFGRSEIVARYHDLLQEVARERAG